MSNHILKRAVAAACGGLFVMTTSFAGPPTPAPSDLTVRVDEVATVPTSAVPNIGSPVPFHGDLLIPDQMGVLYKYSPQTKQVTEIFNINSAPADLDLNNGFDVLLNVQGGMKKDQLYVVFTSAKLPDAQIPVRYLPTGQMETFPTIQAFKPELGETINPLNPCEILLPNGDVKQGDHTFDIYHFGLVNSQVIPGVPGFCVPFNNYINYQVVYEYTYDGTSLTNPRPIVALETQSGSSHTGGGMALAPDGRIIYATGDNMAFGLQGRHGPQNDALHVGKILLIDPNDGSIEVAAKGIRNVQHIQVFGNDKEMVWTDIGGVIAEELNHIMMNDFMDTSVTKNYGWGCDLAQADGNCDFSNQNLKSREGTYYVNLGLPFALGYPAEIGDAPLGEAGFQQPVSQYGRLYAFAFAAITGPVVSNVSFSNIKAIYGDLPSGAVIATVNSLKKLNQPAYQVNLVDSNGTPLAGNTLNAFNNGDRVDPRFFVFPDGTAGVLLEKTGKIYQLTQIDN